MKVIPNVRKILEQEEGSILENVLLDSVVGFSKVFKLLVTLKKPIIAHNAFLDLMFMYQQFYKPLPRMYVRLRIMMGRERERETRSLTREFSLVPFMIIMTHSHE